MWKAGFFGLGSYAGDSLLIISFGISNTSPGMIVFPFMDPPTKTQVMRTLQELLPDKGFPCKRPFTRRRIFESLAPMMTTSEFGASCRGSTLSAFRKYETKAPPFAFISASPQFSSRTRGLLLLFVGVLLVSGSSNFARASFESKYRSLGLTTILSPGFRR